MIRAIAALALMTLPATGTARDTIGIYQGWGAFRDPTPARCYAIARALKAGGTVGGVASVATWPTRGLRASLHVRLSRPRDPIAPVTLSIGERRFTLVARDRDAFAPDAATDRAIVSALRGGRSMSVETLAPGGRPFADVYALAGAATAIDAAGLACARS
ncbi:hypothetical protein ASE75_09730 [Sphingomonas sp. Leaf17]|uniref:hypothetical protein n=1 Tax=Sphingomonas sp. Leaf17 TaxID=1735683 RepID=UPI0006FFE6D1|nr:hypothetical protein [Sphingomonas sp. Leaf17]KQM64262.1 hypothetical protein ASE75_09730 [Sphingomonas sp. Leaf17]